MSNNKRNSGKEKASMFESHSGSFVSSYQQSTNNSWSPQPVSKSTSKTKNYQRAAEETPKSSTFGSMFSTSVNYFKEKFKTKENICFLVIGETGAGKTSVINLFHYWSKNGEQFSGDLPTNFIKMDNENTEGGQSKSQTNKPVIYEFKTTYGSVVYNLKLIDTPGLGDIEGLERDDINVKNILSTVSQETFLDGILLVLNGSNCRVSARTNYILQKIYSICPSSFCDKICLLFTNTQLEPNFDWQNSIQIPILQDNVYCIDNLLYSTAVLKIFDRSQTKVKIKNSYADCVDTLNLMFSNWLKQESLDVNDFKKLADTRQSLQYTIQTILKTLANIEREQDSLEEQKRKLGSQSATIQDLEELKSKTTSVFEVKRDPKPYHSTLCMKCDKICHENCSLSFTPSSNSNIFKGCACMYGDNCKDCKCHFTHHVHVMYICERIENKIPIISPERLKELESLKNREEQIKIYIKEMNNRLSEGRNNSKLHKQQLDANLRDMGKIVQYYDYCTEIRYAMNTIDEELLIANSEQKRVALEKSKIYFSNLLKEYETATNLH